MQLLLSSTNSKTKLIQRKTANDKSTCSLYEPKTDTSEWNI